MPRNARQVIDQEFLITRAKILEVAAFFDRLDAAESGPVDEAKLDLLRQACRILNDGEGDKARRVQLLFSRPYEADWRDKFAI